MDVTTVVVHEQPMLIPGANYTPSTDCSPSDLQLVANVLSSDAIASYEWFGPNGFSSTIANPVIANATANANGTYTLTITSVNGCTAQGSVEINAVVSSVNQPILVSTGAACEGESITISTQQYPGFNVDYIWSVPNTQNIVGLNSNEIIISPANASLHEGNYSVQVLVNGCLVESDTYVLDIFEAAIANPTATSNAICEGGDLQLVANAPNATEYLWEGPNGFTSNAENPFLANVTIENNGTYTLTTSSISNCSSVSSIVVDNIVPTTMTPTITSNSPICDNSDIELTIQENYTGVNVSYLWTNGNGDVVGTTRSISIATTNPLAISPYRVQVTVDGCSSGISEPVEIIIFDLPTTIATNAGGVCAGETTQLFANAIDDATYLWTIVGSNDVISTEQAPFVNPTETTTYQLTIVVNGCTSEASSLTTVQVFDEPTANPTITYMIEENCEASDFMLSANATGNGLTYSWTGPNGFTSDLESPIISNVSEVNNGTYTLVVSNENACTVTESTQVVDVDNALNEPVISSSGSACVGEEIILSIDKYMGAEVTYTWTTPSGTTSNIAGLNTHEIIISPIDPGIHQGGYSVVIEVDGCVTSTEVYTLETFETPVPTPMVESAIVCGNDNIQFYAEPAQGYLWTGPMGFESSTQNPFIENANMYNSGTYLLSVMNAQGCYSEPVAIDVEVLPTPATPTITSGTTSNAFCEDESIELATSMDCANYLWIGPGGSSTITLSNPVLNTSTNYTSIPADNEAYREGLWSVICVSEDGCQSAISDAIEIEIHEIPQTPIPTSSSMDICLNEEVQLFAGENYPDGTTFYWFDADPANGNATLVSTQQNPILSEIDMSGTNTFWLSTSVNGCMSEAAPVEIVTTNAPEVALQTDNGECIESNTSLNLYANPIQGVAPYTYEWSGPNGFSSTNQTPLLPNASNALTGTYTVVMTDANGCTVAASTELDISLIPTEPTIVADNSVCVGESLSISISEYEGTNVHYEWTGPSGTTTSGAYPDANTLAFDNISTSQMGNYQVQVIVDGCSSVASTPFEVITNELPTVAINNSGMTCVGFNETVELIADISNGQGPFDYYWTGPNGFESNVSNPVMANASATLSGTYTLVLTDANGCQAAPVSTFVQVTNLPAIPTLVSSTEELCEGSELFLSTQSYAGDEVSYVWTMADGSTDTTATPGLVIDSVSTTIHDGLISVAVLVDGCSSPMATPMAISILDAPVAPAIINSTDAFAPACEGETVQLQTPIQDNATYTWYGPNGFSSDLPNPSIQNVSPSDTGTYTLVVEINGCTAETATTVVHVFPELEPPITTNDGPGCEGGDVQLQVINPQAEILYDWYRTLDDLYVGSGAVLMLNNVGINEAGGYYVIGNHSLGCSSAPSNTTDLIIDQSSIESAFVGENMLVCEDTVQLTANSLQASEGIWTPIDEDETGIILNPNDPNSMVTNLSLGDNYFVWNVLSGACGITSADTLVITVSSDIAATDDLYVLEINERLESNVVDNDDFDPEQHTVSIVEFPQHGDAVIESDGIITYQPHENYIGTDAIVYEICMDACPDVCTTAIVSLQIGQESPCTIPTIMTPNGDGMNDALYINCLTQYPNSTISIFNRWGDEVYYSENYQNNWEGTFQGEDLPVGTYFYILELNDGNNTTLSGYIFIQR